MAKRKWRDHGIQQKQFGGLGKNIRTTILIRLLLCSVSLLVNFILQTNHFRFAKRFRTFESAANASSLQSLNLKCAFLNLLVLSDRKHPEIPLKAFVNSLLRYTISPIHLSVVTRAPDATMRWLKQMQNPFFRVSLLHPQILMEHSLNLINASSLMLSHPSSLFAIQKLFLPLLPFTQQHQKILMIDDDHVLLRDITPLYDYIQEAPYSLSLMCKPDRFNLRKICRKRQVPHNCDEQLYCVSGMVGFPLTQPARDDLIRSFQQTCQEMTKEYPNSTSSQADQDIFNRYYRFHRQHVQLIPCRWSCGTDECGKRLGTCRGCKPPCNAFHFQVKSFLENITQRQKEWSWNYYFEMDPHQLMENNFTHRIQEKCIV